MYWPAGAILARFNPPDGLKQESATGICGFDPDKTRQALKKYFKTLVIHHAPPTITNYSLHTPPIYFSRPMVHTLLNKNQCGIEIFDDKILVKGFFEGILTSAGREEVKY